LRLLRRIASTLTSALVPRGVRARLTLLVVCALLPGFVLALYGAADTRRRDRAAVQENAYRLARLTAFAHGRTLEGVRQLLRTLARNPAVIDEQSDRCSAELRAVTAQSPRLVEIGRASADGQVRCTSGPHRGADVGKAAWFARSIAGDGFATAYSDVTPAGRGRLVVATGVTAVGRRSALFATLDPATLNSLAAVVPLPDQTSVTLIDGTGVVVARHPDHDKWVGRNVRDVAIVRTAITQHDGSAEGPGFEGTTRLFGFQRLDGESGLVLMVGIPRATAFAPSNRRLAENLLFLCAMAAVTLTLTWIGSEHLMLRTVDRLVRAVRRMSTGDLSARAGVPPAGDELSELSAAFDSMAWNLQRREAEAHEAAEAMRNLALRTETVREQERTAIAREIHDQLGQNLTALRMDVDWISRALAEQPHANAKVPRKLAGMAELLDVTVPLVRNISRRLRPGVLDALGLRPALEWQLEEFQERTGIRTELIGAFDDSQLHPDHATVLFRIFQETLTNIIRHAAARTVTVHLANDGPAALLEVSDDGVGISDLNAMNPRALGLLGMRERAQSVGGRLTIEGRAGRGTTVAAWIPLETSEQHGATR
jgi:signal transduction histidine kinase